MGDAHNSILSKLNKLDITTTLEPSYISRLYQLYHIFGPKGILEISLLYILKGKYYLQSKQIKVTCNGNIYNGRYLIGDLIGRGEDKIDFGYIQNYKIVPFLFPTICPDLLSYLMYKLTLRARVKQALPSYIAISPSILISFENKSLMRLLEDHFTSRNLTYNNYYCNTQFVKTYELGDTLFRSNLYLPFVNKKVTREIENAVFSYLKNLIYKRMKIIKNNKLEEKYKETRKKTKVDNTNENSSGVNSVFISTKIVEYIKAMGNYTFLQICIYVFTKYIRQISVYNNTNIANGKNNNADNTFIYIKEENKYYSIKYHLNKDLELTILQNSKSLLPIVQLAIIKLGFNSYYFKPLRTPNFMQIPYSWEIDYKNEVLNREAKLFELKCRLNEIYPYDNNLNNLVNDNKENNDGYNIRINPDVFKELEKEALIDMFRKKDNFLEHKCTLYSNNMSLFPQLFKYIGAHGILELGLLASSRCNISYSKGIRITIHNKYFNEKLDLFELQKLELISVAHKRNFHSNYKHRYTPNRLLDYIPELIAMLLYKIGLTEDSVTADKHQLLPVFLNFSQTELIEFSSKLITQNIIDRNNTYKYNVNVTDDYIDFHRLKVKNENYKRVAGDIEKKYIEWYNGQHNNMYEEHNKDYEDEDAFFRDIYFDHPADEPSDDEIIE